MILSKAKNIIASKVTRYGSSYTSNGEAFKAIIAKSQVSYDKPSAEFTLLAAYGANVSNGYPIDGQGDHFIPTKIDKPNMMGGAQYLRGYLQQANASLDIKAYVDPVNASKDVWGDPVGVDGTDWRWVIKKTSVYASFERIEMRRGRCDPEAVRSDIS